MDVGTLLVVGGSLIGGGIVAGLIAGLLGVGGGIVIVPVLYWLSPVLHVAPEVALHCAVATSLAVIIPTSISSMRAHHRRGSVDMSLVRVWAPGVAVGAATGGVIAGFLDASALAGVFGVVALVVAINMALPKTIVVAESLPASRPANYAMAGTIGFISSLMGIGGGTMSVPTLSLFGTPIHRAVGTAAVFGLVIAAPGVIGYLWNGQGVAGRPPFSFGYVSLPAAAVLGVATVIFAPMGAHLAHTLNRTWLKRCFAVFLAITAYRMLT